MTHFLNLLLLTYHRLCVLLLFVLFLSLLPCAAYNIRYFGIEIFHLLSLLFRSLVDLLLCHYMYWTHHYISDWLINYLFDPDFQTYLYQVEDASLSRINSFYTTPQDFGWVVFKTHHTLPHIVLHALPWLPAHLDCVDFRNRELKFYKTSYLSNHCLDLGKSPPNLA